MQRTESRYAATGQLYRSTIPYPAISADALTSIQEEIANAIESRGFTLDENDNTQLADAISIGNEFATEITTQAEFTALIERTAANTYQFLDEVKSIVLNIASVTLPLLGGDTWGILSTNYCRRVHSFGECVIKIGDIPSSINVNTNDCRITGVTIEGLQVASAAHTTAFDINATDVILNNCGVRLLLSTNENVNYIAFNLNANDAILYDCFVEDIEFTDNAASDFMCFSGTASTPKTQLHNCWIDDIVIAGDAIPVLFNGLYNIDQVSISNFYPSTANDIYCFVDCNFISDVDAKILTTGTIGVDNAANYVAFFNTCENIINAKTELDTTSDVLSNFTHYVDCNYITNAELVAVKCRRNAYGFTGCNYIINASTQDWITPDTNVTGAYYGFYNSINLTNILITNITAAKLVYGTRDCDYITNIKIYDLQATGGSAVYGLYSVEFLSNAYIEKLDSATNGAAMGGIYNGNYISCCYITDIDNSASAAALCVYNCDYVSCVFANAVNSTAGSEYGFRNCNYVSSTVTTVADTGCDYVDDDDGGTANKYSCNGF